MENEILIYILKILSDNKVYNKYKETFLKNAIIYSIINKDFYFLDKVFNDINNLKHNLNNNEKFKIIVLIKFIMNVFKNTNDKTFHFDETKNEEVINNFKDLFDKVYNALNNSTMSITKKYRKLFLDFLEKYKNKENSTTSLFDAFFTSNKYDEAFIKSTDNLINETNITNYKRIMVRLILSDSLLYNKTIIMDNKNNRSNDFIDDALNIVSNTIIEYITYSIENDKYYLPQDFMIRDNIYYDFLDFNYKNNNMSKVLEKISQDKEVVLNLKKINPLYKLETIDD